jgi:hypothetical protein
MPTAGMASHKPTRPNAKALLVKMVNIKTNNNGLHLVGKRKAKTHAYIRAEVLVFKGCK